MVTFTKVNGGMIRLMGRALILMPMEQPMLENGLTINNTVEESRHGQITQNTMASITRGKSTGEAP
jgi:hypothetical protein